jgi:hypothetical protein
MDAIKLAKELGELQATIEPHRVVLQKDYPDTHAGAVDYMNENSTARVEHEDKFRSVAAHYALVLAPRVKELMYRFEKEKINANQLMHFIEHISSDTGIPILRSRLMSLAFTADGVKLGSE